VRTEERSNPGGERIKEERAIRKEHETKERAKQLGEGDGTCNTRNGCVWKREQTRSNPPLAGHNPARKSFEDTRNQVKKKKSETTPTHGNAKSLRNSQM